MNDNFKYFLFFLFWKQGKIVKREGFKVEKKKCGNNFHTRVQKYKLDI